MATLATNKVLELTDDDVRALIAEAVGIDPSAIRSISSSDYGEGRVGLEVRWRETAEEIQL